MEKGGKKNLFKLTVLGSGTCVPRKKRASPGFFLEIADFQILLDPGPGTIRQLVRAGKDYKEIDLVVLSHLHVDHAGDIPALLFALNYTPDFKRIKDLFFLGGKGLKKFFANLIKTFPHAQPTTYQVKFFDPREINLLDKFKIETLQGNHDSSSILVKVSAFGKTIVYTGDTDYDEKIGQFAKGADLLIAECSYPEEKKVGLHLTPKLVGKIASEGKVKSLLLAHFYPPIDKINLKTRVKKYFSGKVIVAKDLMEIKI